VSHGYDLEPSYESLEQAERLIFEISSSKTTTDLKHVKDMVVPAWNTIEYRYQHKDELSGLSTGFNSLDAQLNGLHKSDLIILAARPAMGKTALALNIAQPIAIKEKVPVCIFSLEMSSSQLVQRMLCSHAEIDAQRVNTGNMLQKDWEKLSNAMSDFEQAPIYIDDTSNCSLTDIRTRCRRLKSQQKDLGLIVIDYLQLMEGGGKEDRLQQISAMSRGLKILAKELDVPIICLSQLSRAVEGRNDKRPMLSDLRESGSIEQDADIVIFIYRDDYYNKAESEDEERVKAQNKGLSEIIIAKHRNGPVGTCKLLFQKNITKFKNYVEQSFDAF
jgi:replicative DNA helicase